MAFKFKEGKLEGRKSAKLEIEILFVNRKKKTLRARDEKQKISQTK